MIGGKTKVPGPRLLVPDDLERLEGELKSRTLKIEGAWSLFHFVILMLQVQGVLMEELVKAKGQDRQEARQWLLSLYKQKLSVYHQELKLHSDSESPKGS